VRQVTTSVAEGKRRRRRQRGVITLGDFQDLSSHVATARDRCR
jgi:uncharacterized protein YggL (DUF469 family)